MVRATAALAAGSFAERLGFDPRGDCERSTPLSYNKRAPPGNAPLLALAPPAQTAYTSRRSPVIAPHAMVACSQPLAAEAGLRVLRDGGNAMDAAVAIAAALAVLEVPTPSIRLENHHRRFVGFANLRAVVSMARSKGEKKRKSIAA